MSDEKQPLSYAAAGVDIDAAHRAMKGVAALVRSTATADTLSELGSFGGLYRVPRDARQPVLVASTDGVGTKLKVAFTSGRHDTVGEDLVNHCVNDILVQGAKPLFFLDYVGVGRLEPGVVEALVEGVARGCRENGCALLGGETAEMPDMYAPGEYDLAGTIVGLVEEDRVLNGRAVRAGDDFPRDPCLLTGRAQLAHDGVRIVRPYNRHHPHAHVEGAEHLAFLHPALALQHAEEGRHRPAAQVEARAHPGREHARHV
ncbi:MAG TPA: AIR synthase related protein, partial [Longimicrobium sp.]|nr:AIR synthase related protein [Longimicrobium sp.]